MAVIQLIINSKKYYFMENLEKKSQPEKAYNPEMIKEAKELIYDYFSRYDRERVEISNRRGLSG